MRDQQLGVVPVTGFHHPRTPSISTHPHQVRGPASGSAWGGHRVLPLGLLPLALRPRLTGLCQHCIPSQGRRWGSFSLDRVQNSLPATILSRSKKARHGRWASGTPAHPEGPPDAPPGSCPAPRSWRHLLSPVLGSTVALWAPQGLPGTSPLPRADAVGEMLTDPCTAPGLPSTLALSHAGD